DGERAAVAFRADAEVTQATTPGGVADTPAVVGDTDGHFRNVRGDLHDHRGRVGMPRGVRQTFANHRDEVTGHGCGYQVDRTLEVQRRSEAERARDVLDDVQDLVPHQPGGSLIRDWRLQAEDGRADLADDGIELAHCPHEPLPPPVRGLDAFGAGNALQGET